MSSGNSPTKLEACVARQGHDVVISVDGEVDLATVDQLRALLRDAIGSDAGAVVLDLSGLSFIDSTGLGVIVGAHNRLERAGRRLVVRSPRDSVTTVLRVAGLDSFLHIERGPANRAPGMPSRPAGQLRGFPAVS